MDQRQRLRDQIDGAASEMVENIHRIEEQAVALKNDVKEVVSLDHHLQVRPYTVLGAALGAGLLAGLILR